jgi:hypothetical protein
MAPQGGVRLFVRISFQAWPLPEGDCGKDGAPGRVICRREPADWITRIFHTRVKN